jgi:hypothetical protein
MPTTPTPEEEKLLKKASKRQGLTTAEFYRLFELNAKRSGGIYKVDPLAPDKDAGQGQSAFNEEWE